MKLAICFFSLMLIAQFAFGQSLSEGKKLFEQKKMTEAKKILGAVDDDHADYAEAQFYLGKINFEAQKYNEAADNFEEAIDTNEKNAEYHYWYGAACGQEAVSANPLRQGILANRIKNAFEKCVELNPKHLDALSGLVQYYLRAPSMMGGSTDKALEMAKKIKAVDKIEGHFAMMGVYMVQKKNAEGEKEMNEVLKTESNKIEMLIRISNGFYTKTEQYPKAFEMFETYLKKNPNNMMAQYQIGKLAAISGQQLDRGETCLKNYLTYKPTDKEPSLGGAHWRLGMIMEKRGNKAEAKKNYETAVKLDPTLKEAKEALKRVS